MFHGRGGTRSTILFFLNKWVWQHRTNSLTLTSRDILFKNVHMDVACKWLERCSAPLRETSPGQLIHRREPYLPLVLCEPCQSQGKDWALGLTTCLKKFNLKGKGKATNRKPRKSPLEWTVNTSQGLSWSRCSIFGTSNSHTANSVGIWNMLLTYYFGG